MSDRGDDDRRIKRIRQACEPCRRKKSRCPGEKPICSHCARLGQQCSYAPDRPDGGPRRSASPNADRSHTSDRLSLLEQGMAQIQELLRRQERTPVRETFASPGAPTMPARDDLLGGAATGELLGREADFGRGTPFGRTAHAEMQGRVTVDVTVLSEVEGLFTTFCDCQPLPLFAPNQIRLQSRSLELQIAMVMLVSRFHQVRNLVETLRLPQAQQRVRSHVTQRLADGPVELDTLQTLCLLSLIEFHDGSTARASFYSSTAMDLAQSAGLASEYPGPYSSDVEERRRCYWSIVLLKNFYGNMAGRFSFVPSDYTPRYPNSTQPPSRSVSSIKEPGLPQPDAVVGSTASADKDLGILAYVSSMSEIWAQTVRYARRRGKSQQPPPWAPASEYQGIMAKLMDFETRMPYKYRYKPARFSEYSPAEVQQSRTFWAPWFLNQVLYHSLLSLLNHPLILALQLRNFDMTMVPEVFLQHTDDLTQTHTDWVVHLVDEFTAKDFLPSDPYPAYCVAIVASIFLQQSYADDDEISTKKQDNFLKCLNFIRKSGVYWPRIAQLANKVDAFQKLVEASRNAATPDGRTHIDLRLFWDIIEACFTTELPTGPEAYFGASLLSHRTTKSADVVNGRLLPPPTRLEVRGGSAANTPSQRTRASFTDQAQMLQAQQAFQPLDDEFSVLAQSYFAQGQDFVNLDDWWITDQQPV